LLYVLLPSQVADLPIALAASACDDPTNADDDNDNDDDDEKECQRTISAD